MRKLAEDSQRAAQISELNGHVQADTEGVVKIGALRNELMDEAAGSTQASSELFRRITEAIAGVSEQTASILTAVSDIAGAADLARTAEELSALTAHFVL